LFQSSFGLLHTVIFLFRDGWHYKAISPVENILDYIFSVVLRLSLTGYLISICMLANILMEFFPDKKSKEETSKPTNNPIN
jgi:hypothetical protein